MSESNCYSKSQILCVSGIHHILEIHVLLDLSFRKTCKMLTICYILHNILLSAGEETNTFVLLERLELSRLLGHQILSLTCIPIPPQEH